MSNSLFNQYIDLLRRASSSSNEAERNRLVVQSNIICAMPAFANEKSNTSSNSSNNGFMYQTNIAVVPANRTAPMNGWCT